MTVEYLVENSTKLDINFWYMLIVSQYILASKKE